MRNPILTARTLLLAIAALGLAASAGCEKKKKDDHWTGGQGGAPGAAMSGEPDPAAGGGTTARGMAARGAEPGRLAPGETRPKVVFRTTQGDFLVELYADKAPITVKNFLRYVDEKFYDGTIFHRVMVDFMIQGGGFTEDLQQKPTHEPIKNEADNGLANTRGTIAMARTMVVDSATAQFFVNVKDNAALDHRGPGRAFGYAVFGKVVQGMEVVDKIRRMEVAQKGLMFQHLPTTTVLIKSVRRAK